jgi:hypothetical protein
MIIVPERWACSKIIDAINRISIETPNGIIKKMIVENGLSMEIVLEPVLKVQQKILVKAYHLDGKSISIDNGKRQTQNTKSADREVVVRVSSVDKRFHIRLR